jgi:hypothetical protein
VRKAQHKSSGWPSHSLLFLGLLLMLPWISGCQGCRQDPDAQGDSADGEAPVAKEEFDFEKLSALPDLEAPANQAKPGHWVSGHRKITANDYDFQGRLENRVIDSVGRPIPTEMTDHYLTTKRPVSLPKGQTKDVEVMYYIPRRLQGENRIVTLEQELFDRTGGRVEVPNGGVNLMPAYRYFFVVLSQSPGSFNYVKTLPAMVMPNVSGERLELFRVVVPTIGNYVPLPSDSSAWTSFAFLLWDDLDPALLDPKQQQSLLDWLHFGGQLIVSGSSHLDQLERSFLGPYLPAHPEGARELDDEDVRDLSDYWSIASAKGETLGWKIGDSSKVLGNELSLTDRGRWMEHGEGLVAESNVGRGRVVMTAFPLNHRSLLAWPAFDSFFNNALMRRPRRGYAAGPNSFESEVQFHYTDFRGHELDPRFFSTLRYVSRDLGFQTEFLESEQRKAEQGAARSGTSLPAGGATSIPQARIADRDRWHIGGYRYASLSGVAGWNDGGAVARQAQSVLDASAGIEPPSSQFVLAALGIYLTLLVPVNWLVFRLLGRVEWAWVAAPVIAVVAAVGIVRTAQLDIGFARSQTELSVLELQSGYSRGHLTRYASLYSSLSTEFMVDFDADDARGQPWGSPMESRAVGQNAAREVELSLEGGVKLANVLVNSNSAELVHLEQMIDVGGTVVLSGRPGQAARLDNATDLILKDVGIFGLDADNQIQRAWVGELGAKEEVTLRWQRLKNEKLTFEEWEANPITKPVEFDAEEFLGQLDENRDGTLSLREIQKHEHYDPEWDRRFDSLRGEANQSERRKRTLNLEEVKAFIASLPKEDLWLGGLFQLLSNQLVGQQKSSILVGWTEQNLPGTDWSPAPSQVKRRMLVVVHLDELPWNPVVPDTNLLSDVHTIEDDIDVSEEELQELESSSEDNESKATQAQDEAPSWGAAEIEESSCSMD